MGLFDRMEGKLENAVFGAFAKAFRSEVQPVEIASAIRRAMDDRAAIVGKGRSLVPNVFTIELSETDYERLSSYGDSLEDELVAAAEEHADSQHYQAGGPVDIILTEDDSLETGVFRVRPSTAKRPRATGLTGQQPSVRRPSKEQDADWYAEESGPSAGAPGASRTDRPAAMGSGAASGVAAAAGAAAYAVSHEDDGHDSAYGDDDNDEDDEPTPYRGNPKNAAAPLPRTAAHPPVPKPQPRRVNPADRPWLDVDGERYPLMGAMTILGRDDAADIILDDPGISRRHSEIRVTTDGPHFVATIRDLGSTNGTFVNGDRITSEHLHEGDRVTVGRTTVTYRGGRADRSRTDRSRR
jgi:hypothetical protein